MKNKLAVVMSMLFISGAYAQGNGFDARTPNLDAATISIATSDNGDVFGVSPGDTLKLNYTFETNSDSGVFKEGSIQFYIDLNVNGQMDDSDFTLGEPIVMTGEATEYITPPLSFTPILMTGLPIYARLSVIEDNGTGIPAKTKNVGGLFVAVEDGGAVDCITVGDLRFCRPAVYEELANLGGEEQYPSSFTMPEDGANGTINWQIMFVEDGQKYCKARENMGLALATKEQAVALATFLETSETPNTQLLSAGYGWPSTVNYITGEATPSSGDTEYWGFDFSQKNYDTEANKYPEPFGISNTIHAYPLCVGVAQH
ncbi:hypothetical protein HRJ45_23505 [Vibrio coralliilyticus]|uniref:hypothetical protein n=1 Tax=Vibrio coralliilyticus TaxID=190893 RepID=UPI00155FB92D|nr:hypothetical protein [Vibrio coralliilyticus]NRF27956.1 hypothetical protein [Vibrio coralliilyticus]NRF82082.1 hypothetical protein [Vibrio coralliilyticus]